MPAAETRDVVLAIFDLDRTVTRRGTWLPFLDFVLRAEGRRRLWVPLVLRIAKAWAFDRSGRTGMKEAALGVALAGMPRARLEALARAYADRVVDHALRPGAVQAIEAHKRQGHRLMLATASMDIYATGIARRLEFDAVVATRAAWTEDDRLAPHLDGPNIYGQDKLDAVIGVLEAAQMPRACAAYSDHISDLPLLAWCARAVAVNPGRKLKRVARARGIEIADWNSAANAPDVVCRIGGSEILI